MIISPIAGPPDDVWTAAIHTSAGDTSPIGSGVVIDERRVLTCAHVVAPGGVDHVELWLSFPKAPLPPSLRCKVTSWRRLDPRDQDVAVLILESPVPGGVVAAPLRCPRPPALFGDSWWAFGFPYRDTIGDVATGTVGAHLGNGWVRLDAMPTYAVLPGFSGGGLWSHRYAAIVGLVGQARHDGDGRAVTLFQADMWLPEEKLASLAEGMVTKAAGEEAAAAWGWALHTDPEGRRHWRPRARGVSVDSETGFRFRGRTAALQAIVEWLDRPVPDRRALVVTGSPGVGKSAVLGRVVTSADAAVRAALPPDDAAIRASLGSVACAVHAKGKTALDVAGEIARAASAGLPQRVEDLTPALREVLIEKQRRPKFNVIIDAVDEAASPLQARAIVTDVVLPLVQTCADVGVQVVVGSRLRDDDGDLMAVFAGAAHELNLDEKRYFELDDLVAYAKATLQLHGAERVDNPYRDDETADLVARRIAELAQRNFLVAGLQARSHGIYDNEPVDPDTLELNSTVDSTLAAYLDRIARLGQLSARQVLTALAYAQAPGLTGQLWQVAVEALAHPVGTEALARFARSAAANFLIESRDDGHARSYQLFHQALNDALLRARHDLCEPADDERLLVTAFADYGRRVGWPNAPGYLLRSLPVHADRAGLIDNLLSDDEYLLHADLRRLNALATHASTPAGQERARLLRLTPKAIDAVPSERAGMFSVVAAIERIEAPVTTGPAYYRARWANATAQEARVVLRGHVGSVHGVCAVRVGGREVLASAGEDATVRLWDPATGAEFAVLSGHAAGVLAVCAVRVGGREVLASAGRDETIRLWDPATGVQSAVLHGHACGVSSLCGVRAGGRELLASGGDDSTIRLWDPAAAAEHAVLRGHGIRILGLCAVRAGGRELLASAGEDATLRLWDPITGSEHAILRRQVRGFDGVCALRIGDRDLLASVGREEKIRLWDPATGAELAVLDAMASSVCAIHVEGRELLVSGSNYDARLRLWDPATGAELGIPRRHRPRINGVCSVRADGRELLVSCGEDGTVRLWNPTGDGAEQSVPNSHAGWVFDVCPVRAGDRELVASAGDDATVRLYDAITGAGHAVLRGHTGAVSCVSAFPVGGREMLLSAGRDDHKLRLWDPVTGAERVIAHRHAGWIRGLCPVRVGGRDLLASAGQDATVRLWDPISGAEHAVLPCQSIVLDVTVVRLGGRELVAAAEIDGALRLWDPITGAEHAAMRSSERWVSALCSVRVGDRDLLASAGRDTTVRLWDLDTGAEHAILRGHTDMVEGVCALRRNGRELLFSAGFDATVRVWDPASLQCLRVIPTHHPTSCCTTVDGAMIIGLSDGVLAIDLNDTARSG